MGALQQALLGIPRIAEGDFDPTTIAGCTMWVSADDPLLASLNDGDPVSPWTDRVTGTRTWTQSAAGNKPTYKTNIVNGKPVLRFDSDDFLDFSVAGSNIFSAPAWTMVFVIKPDSNGTVLGTEGGKNLIHNNGFIGLCLFDAGAGVNKFRHYRFDGGYVGVNSTTTYSLGTWYIVAARYDGTNLYLQVNNDTETSVAASNPSSLTNIPRMSRNTSIVSDIAEAAIWNVDVGTTNLATIRNAWGAEYAI